MSTERNAGLTSPDVELLFNPYCVLRIPQDGFHPEQYSCSEVKHVQHAVPTVHGTLTAAVLRQQFPLCILYKTS